ncbi:hypothetical protein Nepgr_011673 [Nepenthes gracilis]|uniref:HMA domain-containing protein n=1 Tax=Nepenthes gracilis TaxID=150966 RepID=A0AAD3SEU6_NEPGR|nr:hypothetical protein Nepgr_011673 [Nepenthes gracilis]
MGEQKEGEKKGDAVAAKKDDGTVTVVLKLDLHCEGCAKKVRRSVKNFDGVESVKADRGNNTLTVIGNVDPVKIKERVEEKTKKKVELISPQPKKGKEDGGGNGDKKSDEKSKKSDDKKTEEKTPKEPPVKTVVLKTRVHCDGCALKIKRIVRKCEGVQDVNVDLQKDLVTVKGTMNMNEILPYLNTKMKRSVEIVPAAKKDDAGSGDKKPKEGGGEKKEKEGGGEKKEKAGGGGGGGDQKENAKPAAGGGGEAGKSGDNANKVEVNKLEHYGYPYGYGGYIYDPSQGHGNGYSMEYWHAPSPQMFSDENPNACSVM